MPLLEIEDPIAIQENDGEIAVGIDFGTTNSLCYYFDGGRMNTIVDIMPSIVYYDENANITDAKNAKHTIKSIKRYLAQNEQITVGNKKFWAEQIAAEIFRKIKLEIESELENVKKCVVTVPAYFTDPQKQAVKFAAELAGFEVIRMIAEPTAAALYYNIDNQSEGIYIIFDIGGGTFDISILRMTKGVLHVIATGGDAALGGDDFDILIANHYGITIQTAKQIKEEISYHNQVTSIGLTGISIEDLQCLPNTITQSEINEIIMPLIQKCINIMQSTIADSGITDAEMQGIVLVGGLTRMPIIKEVLERKSKVQVFANADPDRIVAFGAAMQAYNIVKKSTGNILLDVIPLSLGIETMGGAVHKVIERNSSIPIESTVSFTTYEDFQSGIIINVVQGERDLAKDCRSLASFEITNLTPVKAGMVKVYVKFYVDENSILEVSAWEEGKESKSQIMIRPSYGINGDSIRAMLVDAINNAQEDIESKMLADIKIEGQNMLKMINEALLDKHLATKKESEQITDAKNQLESAIQEFDRHAIDSAIKTLDTAAQSFVEKRTSFYLNKYAQGKNVDEVL